VLFVQKADGKTIPQVVTNLLNAYNPDTLEDLRLQAEKEFESDPPQIIEDRYKELTNGLLEEAASVFTGELNEYIENVRKAHAQIIDHINPDKIIKVGWDAQNTANAETLIKDFAEWIELHKNEITALQIFFGQPYQRRDLTYKMIKEVFEILKTEKPLLAPLHVWHAYEQLGKANGSPKNELMALVSLIRKVSGIDDNLTTYDKTVDKNFQQWVFSKQAGSVKFNEEQMQWLRMIKEYVAASFHIEHDDFDLSPFNAIGGLSKMWQLFGEQTDDIINELNEVLAA
jgi:type I restriction enzyme R subunit